MLPFRKFDNAALQNDALETYRSHPKVQQLIKLVTLIGDLSEGFCDPLGELYMQAISNGYNGQYFTPENVCDMMAIMSVDDNSLPGQTVCDCMRLRQDAIGCCKDQPASTSIWCRS